MYCTKCGKKINSGAKYCVFCGSPVCEKDIDNDVVEQQKYKASRNKRDIKNIFNKKRTLSISFGVFFVFLLIIVATQIISTSTYKSLYKDLESGINEKNLERLIALYPIEYFNEESRKSIENSAKELKNYDISISFDRTKRSKTTDVAKNEVLNIMENFWEGKAPEIGKVNKIHVIVNIYFGTETFVIQYNEYVYEIYGEWYLGDPCFLEFVLEQYKSKIKPNEESANIEHSEDKSSENISVEDINSEAKEEEIVPVTYDSYEALGAFSEGLALVRRKSDGKLAYIDSEGNIKIVLPEKYLSATEFSDGRATICTGDVLFISQNNIKYGWTFPSMLNYEYALIDKEGNIIVDLEEYDFIGKTSEGKTLVYKVQETYQGTEKNFGFIDSDGNLLFELNAESYLPWDDSLLNLEDIFFHKGTAVFINDNTNGQDFIDEAGNIVQCLAARDSMESVYYDVSFINSSYDDASTLRVYNRITNETETISTNDIKQYLSHGYINSDYFIDGYVVITGGPSAEDRDKFIIIDTSGNVVSINSELDVTAVMETMEDAWVLELQNGYFGIIDHTAQLLFEPIQEEIVYLGDGLFYGKASKSVFNKYGEHQFVPEGVPYDSPWYQNAISLYTYSEGFIIVNVAGTNRFMDMNGNILWESVAIEGKNMDDSVFEETAEYSFGEAVVQAICQRDEETLYAMYHPAMQEANGKDFLLSVILGKADAVFETTGDYIVSFESEVVWNGVRSMEGSNIAHAGDIESIIGSTIEDFRHQAYKVTSSLATESELSATIDIYVFKTDGKWYLTWMS